MDLWSPARKSLAELSDLHMKTRKLKWRTELLAAVSDRSWQERDLLMAISQGFTSKSSSCRHAADLIICIIYMLYIEICIRYCIYIRHHSYIRIYIYILGLCVVLHSLVSALRSFSPAPKRARERARWVNQGGRRPTGAPVARSARGRSLMLCLARTSLALVMPCIANTCEYCVYYNIIQYYIYAML